LNHDGRTIRPDRPLGAAVFNMRVYTDGKTYSVNGESGQRRGEGNSKRLTTTGDIKTNRGKRKKARKPGSVSDFSASAASKAVGEIWFCEDPIGPV